LHTVAVIGQGFVGGSLTTVLSERGNKVYTYDKAGKNSKGGIKQFKFENVITPENLEIFIECCESIEEFSGIYFICLPTPMNLDGSCDTSIVESVLQVLSENINSSKQRIAIVKSTVPPGTTETWNKKYEKSAISVVFNPEFLTEANAIDDMRNQDRIIIGGPIESSKFVTAVFKSSFPTVPIFETSSTNAEMVKYVANCFLATKVSFANEMYQGCKALFEAGYDISYNSIIELATLDKRLGNSHWQVPGPMPSDDTGEQSMGFGGSCFPKDINALIYLLEKNNVDPKVLKGVWEKNLEVRPRQDWKSLKGRAISNVED